MFVSIALSAFIGIYVLKSRSKHPLSDQDIKVFFQGEYSGKTEEALNGGDLALSLKYNKEFYEIPESKFVTGESLR